MSYSVNGAFSAFEVGDGAWRLSTGNPGGVQIQLRGTSANAVPVFAAAPHIERVVLEWSRDVVIVTLTLAGGVTALTAQNAIVHEPQPELYRCLPLAEFDAAARSFWKRVFRLMRIPGGRFLLGLITRKGRSSR